MASKLCDSCKSATASVFCRADTAFLCLSCDPKIHAANKLASRHARVWMCEVCEQAPAHVTCKADAAALCISCDRDIHSANPLARRHERIPVTPFYDPPLPAPPPSSSSSKPTPTLLNYFSDDEEAEAASWLLPNPNSKSDAYAFPEAVDPYLDLEDYVGAPKQEDAADHNSSGTDGVVPVQSKLVNDHASCYDLDFSSPFASKPPPFHHYHFNSSSTPCLSHSMSTSSSMEVGVVPEGDIYSRRQQQGGVEQGATSGQAAAALSGVDREARVLRYREKRKTRKFEKTIRYASRKAYAETRPRIKGRFAKRSDLHHDSLLVDPSSLLGGFGVVPSF